MELLRSKADTFATGDHEASADLGGFLSGDHLGGGKIKTDVTLEMCPSLKHVKGLEGVDLLKSLGFWKFRLRGKPLSDELNVIFLYSYVMS